MSDIEYIQALSQLRAGMKRHVLDQWHDSFPRHLVKAYWEIRYCFHWLYDEWGPSESIDDEVVKLGSARLIAETLVSEYGFSWVEGSDVYPAIQHDEIWPNPISLRSIDSGTWVKGVRENWLRESRHRQLNKSAPFKVGEITFEFYFYIRAKLAWKLRHKDIEEVRPLLPEERLEIDRVLADFRERWKAALNTPPTSDFSGTEADIYDLSWLMYEGCYGFIGLEQLGLVQAYVVGLVLSSSPNVDLVMAKLSDNWQLALRGLPKPDAITTMADYRGGCWFHRQAASWFDENIDEPSEEGYSLDYFEFVQEVVRV